jgi:hypothetical protein
MDAVKNCLETKNMKAVNVLTTREAALRLSISIRRLMALLAEGRLPGSYKVGLIWQIPLAAIETRVREKAKFYARRMR